MTLDAPVSLPARHVAGDWSVLPAWMPVPGMGVLPAQSFLLRGAQPMLVDTGLAALAEDYLATLCTLVDPADLRWIWISHLDADHVGNLGRVLELAPQATVLTGFLGAGKMQLAGIAPPRLRVVEAGQRIDLGDRELVPLRPPYYDAPETLGFFDGRDRVLFAVDAFGAVLPAVIDAFDAIDPAALDDGLRAWSAIDAPWLAQVDASRFATSLEAVARLDPTATLTGHLPPISGDIRPLLARVGDAWCRPGAEPSPQLATGMEAALAALAA